MRPQALLQGLMSGKARPVGPMGYGGRAADAAGRAAQNIASGPGVQGYLREAEPMAEGMQEALMQLAGRIPVGEIAGKGKGLPGQSQVVGAIDRMAASPQVLNALKATPAIAGIYGTTVGADVINQMISEEDESFANTGMDLLGMGFAASDAAYGINRGIGRTGGTTRAGAALKIAAAAGLGKMGSDALQGLVGI
jgi:hypothetical protein